MSTIAVILAGGRGTRMMNNIPKQFMVINDKPLIVHTLLKFASNPLIDKIAIICLRDYKKHLETLIDDYNIPKVEYIIDGGSNRHHSIANAILFLKKVGVQKDDIVVVHNANMPMVTESNISDCVKKCKDGMDIVSTAAKCTGFFYQLEDDKWIIGPNREKMFGAKTPEAIRFDVADEMYNNAMFEDKQYESFTAGMLGIVSGKKIDVVFCELTNIKVTTEDDYRLVSTYLSSEKHSI